MKKFTFMIVIAFTLMTLNANATCDPGWTPADFSYLYDSDNDNIGDCEITVYYCYIILPDGVFHINVDAVTIEIDCGIPLLDDPNFWGDLEQRLKKHLTETGNFEPCPLTAFNVKIWRAKCWKIENDPIHQRVNVLNCGYTAYCEKKYKICWDSDLGKNVIILVEFNTIGTPDCPDEMPMLPPLLKTWNDEWTTDCYGVSCAD